MKKATARAICAAISKMQALDNYTDGDIVILLKKITDVSLNDEHTRVILSQHAGMRNTEFRNIRYTKMILRENLRLDYAIKSDLDRIPIATLMTENGEDKNGDRCIDISNVCHYDFNAVLSETLKILAYRQEEIGTKKGWNKKRESQKEEYDQRFGDEAYYFLVKK